MEPGRLGDGGAEMAGQPAAAQLFVNIINPGLGAILGQVVQQVADIMEQGRGDQRAFGSRLFGGPAGLERMLGLADRFADIGGIAALAKQLEDFIN
jgi:hypothetical protein